jgi:hypothetical protein
MSLLDSMRDIIKHTNGLGFIDTVKIIGTSKTAKLQAIDVDHTTYIYGELKSSIPDIDSTVGISRIQVLRGYMENPSYNTPTSSVTVVREERNGTSVPSELKFDNGDGTISNYRFMSDMMINDKINLPSVSLSDWDVKIVPEKRKISELSYNSNVLGMYEKRVIIFTDKNKLKFAIGDGPNDRVEMVFSDNITGKISKPMLFPIDKILKILKLSDSAVNTTMSFNSVGVLKIDIDSGIGDYSYVIPAIKTPGK